MRANPGFAAQLGEANIATPSETSALLFTFRRLAMFSRSQFYWAIELKVHHTRYKSRPL